MIRYDEERKRDKELGVLDIELEKRKKRKKVKTLRKTLIELYQALERNFGPKRRDERRSPERRQGAW